jgi:hypothetical protein
MDIPCVPALFSVYSSYCDGATGLRFARTGQPEGPALPENQIPVTVPIEIAWRDDPGTRPASPSCIRTCIRKTAVFVLDLNQRCFADASGRQNPVLSVVAARKRDPPQAAVRRRQGLDVMPA